MASKEKVDIKRSDQFQEMDEELTKAMEDLDSTIDRISLIFQSNSEEPGGAPLTEDESDVTAPAAEEPAAADTEVSAAGADVGDESESTSD